MVDSICNIKVKEVNCMLRKAFSAEKEDCCKSWTKRFSVPDKVSSSRSLLSQQNTAGTPILHAWSLKYIELNWITVKI